MARPTKDTVDYFPHSCNHGKTMFIIEQHYGNDGYAFWFKLLELLGKSEGHYINCNNIDEWEFLQATTRFLEVKCREILNKLALLGAIDKELWDDRQIIWSDNFIKNIADAYKNRKRPVPLKPFQPVETPTNNNSNVVSTGKTPVSTTDNPQKKREEKKINNNKPTACAREADGLDGQTVDNVYPIGKPESATPGLPVDRGRNIELSADDPEFMAFWSIYPKQTNPEKAQEAWNTLRAQGVLSRDLLDAARKYAAEARASGVEKRFYISPTRFLAERRYLEYLSKHIPECSRCKGTGYFYHEEPDERGGTRAVAVECDCRQNYAGGEHG